MFSVGVIIKNTVNPQNCHSVFIGAAEGEGESVTFIDPFGASFGMSFDITRWKLRLRLRLDVRLDVRLDLRLIDGRHLYTSFNQQSIIFRGFHWLSMAAKMSESTLPDIPYIRDSDLAKIGKY